MSRCKAGTSGSRRCRCPTPSRCASSACTPTRCTRRPWRPSRCRARRPAGSAANPCATRRCWTGHRSSCGRSSATRWSAQRDRGQCRPRDLDGLADLGRCPMWTLVELAVRALANEDRDHDIGPPRDHHRPAQRRVTETADQTQPPAERRESTCGKGAHQMYGHDPPRRPDGYGCRRGCRRDIGHRSPWVGWLAAPSVAQIGLPSCPGSRAKKSWTRLSNRCPLVRGVGMSNQTIIVPSRASCDPAARVTRSLLGYGVIAGPAYVLVSLLQAVTRDGFDLRRHAWSLLSNGHLGWIQVTNFVVTGLATVAFSIGLRRALRSGRGGSWAPRLIGVYGASLIGAGVFRADPALGFPPGTPPGVAEVSWHGIAHFILGGIGFTCLVAACIVLAFVAAVVLAWTWVSALAVHLSGRTSVPPHC